ncbi:MAG: beta-galactosidase [Planctomycetes bacterium]|nr:beta-galactosidase [Planctomycetota bacterium]
MARVLRPGIPVLRFATLALPLLLSLLLAPASASAAPPRVAITDGVLSINGTPTYLYGAEVQYFRIRAADSNPVATKAMWAATLDKMVAAGMNLVCTYVPWDYHEPTPGGWQFSGAKDLDYFLNLCYERHLYVVIKPGPYITAEWPTGFGSFGAVPQWLKDANPATLVRRHTGLPWSFALDGAPTGRQCTYLHPTFLHHVRRWFTKLAPTLRKYIDTKPCIVMVQLDNETNLFWEDHYKVDYSPTALAHYREFLSLKYGSIAALNAAYGTAYTAFPLVQPPVGPPLFPAAERGKNPWHWDWFDAGAAYIQRYLTILRHEWELRGIREPKIKFTLNDGPQGVPARWIVMYNGLRKNAVALDTLDLYPKVWPTNNDLLDVPFQVDQATKLFDRHNDLNTGAQDFVMASEIQGGYFEWPYGLTTNVRPQATGQTLAKLAGHGMKAGSLYVMRGGFNADNSVYAFQAALTPAGVETPRYDVLKNFGTKLFSPYGVRLMRTREVENRLAIVVNQKYAYPQGGILEDMESVVANEYGGLFGWAMTAGYNPAVLDLEQATAAQLAAFKAVLYVNPDYLSEADAAKLAGYVAGGGTLINFLWRGDQNLKWQAGAAAPGVTSLTSALFPAAPVGYKTWFFQLPLLGPGLVLRVGGDLNAAFPGYGGTLKSQWYYGKWAPPPGATPFLWERLAGGANGAPVGYRSTYGAGKTFHVGAWLTSDYNRNCYYGLDPADMAGKTALLDWLMGEAGVARTVDSPTLRAEVWARRGTATDEAYLFVINGGPAQTVHVGFHDTAALGLIPGKTYALHRLLADLGLPARTPASLTAEGLDLPLGEFGYEVVRLW